MTLIDISLPLKPDVPIWPGSTGYRRRQVRSFSQGDGVNVSEIAMDVHTGTHVDAPAHFVEGGAALEAVELQTLIGPCEVLDTGTAPTVTRTVLEQAGLRGGAVRVLLRTTNSELWSSPFSPDYVALDEDAAEFVVSCGVKLIGIDYLSVQRFRDGPAVHEILLRKHVVILEGLCLAGVSAGRYDLLCLPLALMGAEGAPARAVLRPLDSTPPVQE